MKKVLTSALAVALLGLTVATLHAGDCGPAGCAPCGPSWVEQKITAYRCEQRTRPVERIIQRMHTRIVEEPCHWMEWEKVVTPVTHKEHYWLPQWREVAFKYQACEWFTEPQQVKVTHYRQQLVEEPYKYWVCETVVVPVKKIVTVCHWQPREVVENVQVCHMVASCMSSCCGGCRTCWTPAWETCQVKRTYMECVPTQQEIVVHECRPNWVQKDSIRRYYVCVPYQVDTVIQVCKHRWVEKEGRKMVCDMIPQTRDVVCNVVSCRPVERHGTRKRVVCEWHPDKVIVNEVYCEWVPYETVVRVPVGCADWCYGGHCGHSHRCGFFGRCCH